jgi:predicted small lipoprotein YifL
MDKSKPNVSMPISTNRRIMKKALAIALVGISLAGCGTKTIVVAPSTTEQVTTTTADAVSREDTFFQNVMNNYPTLVANQGRAWVIDFGHTLCSEIDGGMTFGQLARMGASANIDLEMLGYITGEAIRNLCPRNQWFIDTASSANA